MIKKLLIFGVLVVAIYGFVRTNIDSTDTNIDSVNTNAGQDTVGKIDDSGIARYEPYDGSTLARQDDAKRVLFFHANWCSICNEFESQIESSGVPEGITIIKANYDKDLELRKQYKVNVQSTFILLDENNEEIQRWPFGAGIRDMADLYDQINEI